jgi:NAD dependent epimerase/dehydratase family enzyme
MARMLPIFRLGLGGPLGDGRQWMSWVSARDTGRVLAFLAGTEEGPAVEAVNVVAPNPVTNAEFTRELGRALHRPAFLPAPALALRLAFGEMADAALLASTRVLPRRLQEMGFRFEDATLGEAFRSASL